MSFCDCGELDIKIITPENSQDCADAYGGKEEDWSCKDGAYATWNLDYCLDNKNPENSKFPVKPLKDDSFIEQIVDGILDPTVVLSTLPSKDIKPDLQITVPDLKFSKTTLIEKIGASGKQTTFVNVPYLGEYLRIYGLKP